MAKRNEHLLTKRHRIWLAMFQDQAFPPTVKDLATAWGVSSTSVVMHTINTMVRLNLAAYEQRGAYRRYYPLIPMTAGTK